MNTSRALLLPLSLLAAHSAFAECRYTADRNAELDASGVSKIVASTGAGDLVVYGDAAATHVRITGEACADSAKNLDRIQLETRRDGDTIYVKTVMPEQRGLYPRAALDLKLAVPSSITLDLQDSSGDVEISAIAAAKIDDSSGDQSIRDIAGNVTVDDSSGEVEIEGVRGDVLIRDSSGDVSVSDVAGNVKIAVDSSGDLRLRRIRGDAHIVSDSSGDIVLAEINQNVRIDHDSSGGIRVSDVGGDFLVEDDSSGGISHRNVLGRVSIPRQD